MALHSLPVAGHLLLSAGIPSESTEVCFMQPHSIRITLLTIFAPQCDSWWFFPMRFVSNKLIMTPMDCKMCDLFALYFRGIFNLKLAEHNVKYYTVFSGSSG